MATISDEKHDEQAGGGLVSDDTQQAGAVSPPGDLPLPAVEARLAARAHHFRHDNTISPLAPRPGEPVEIRAAAGTGIHLARTAIFYTCDGSAPDAASARAPMEIAGVEWDDLAGYLTSWRGTIPPQPAGTIVRYRIGGWYAGASEPASPDTAVVEPDLWAHDGQGFWFRYPGERGITTFAYSVEPPAPPMPSWVYDAVIYHIFLDRFHPGTPDGAFPRTRGPNERHGGTLHGVRQALPYLHDLGATCLWLSPHCPSETYHRYDATDLYGVDPELGTAQDLRDLVAAAHEHGIRVLLDFVPSHCSWHHPAFVAAQRDRNAPTASWFTFDAWPHDYRSFLQMVPSLPSFNTSDPGARAHIIGSAVQWLRDFGVDGFRIDHAIGPGMDFWVALRAAIRTIAPDAVTIGEVTDTPDVLRRYRNRLDAVLDFPLARALRFTFGTGSWNLDRLDSFLSAHTQYMAEGPGRVSFLDNHDMNRFLFVASNDVSRLKLAALCHFTLEATPTIYYGTEIGLEQQHDIAQAGYSGDAEVRQDMPWDERRWNRDLHAFYRALIRLRRDRDALRRGDRQTLHLDRRAGTYAYARTLCGAATVEPGDAVVLFNLSGQEQAIDLAAPANGLTCLLSTGAAPRIDGRSGRACVTLSPMSGAIVGLTRA